MFAAGDEALQLLPRLEVAKLGRGRQLLVVQHQHAFDHRLLMVEQQARLILLDALEKQGEMYGIAGVRNVTPDRWLEEGDTVTVAGHTFAIFHCPGHSPGSVVFFNQAQHFALVGDVIFQGSIGRTDFPYGDHDALISAIKEKLLPLGDDITFVCGHGPPSQFGHERRTNPFLV